MLLLLLSRFSRVQLCATPETAAHQAPLSLGFSRQEHWSGVPFPSPMHESAKWKWSRSVMPDSLRPHGLQPTRLLCPWGFPGKRTAVGRHCLLQQMSWNGNWWGTILGSQKTHGERPVWSVCPFPHHHTRFPPFPWPGQSHMAWTTGKANTHS